MLLDDQGFETILDQNLKLSDKGEWKEAEGWASLDINRRPLSPMSMLPHSGIRTLPAEEVSPVRWTE